MVRKILHKEGNNYPGVGDYYIYTKHPLDFTGGVIKDNHIIKTGIILVYGKIVDNVLTDRTICLTEEEFDSSFTLDNEILLDGVYVPKNILR